MNEDELLDDEYICQMADSVFEDQAVCDPDYIANYPGTARCVSGPVKVYPGEIGQYEYLSNLKNEKITWSVVSGSITLEDGQNTSSAKFRFDNDFTTGCISGRGEIENEDMCSESFRISLYGISD